MSRFFCLLVVIIFIPYPKPFGYEKKGALAMRHINYHGLFPRLYRKRALSRSANGQAILEIIASLLIFIGMVCLIISISLYLYVQHAAVTAVREGARFASLNTNIGDPLTQAQGIDEVKDYMIDSTRQLTGMTVSPDDIEVIPPETGAPQGQRTVRLDVSFMMDNPIPAGQFLQGLGAKNNRLDRLPINATATMRYEE